MRKRMLALLVCLVLACLLPWGHGRGNRPVPHPVPAAPDAPDADSLRLPPVSEAPLLQAPPMRLDCAAALLMEADSGQVIFEMNADSPRPVASVTKVMTILLTLEQMDAGRVSPETAGHDLAERGGHGRLAGAAGRG